MQMMFKAIQVRPGSSWVVVLTTPEGDSHEIDGFQTAADACGWIERETGQRVQAPPPA